MVKASDSLVRGCGFEFCLLVRTIGGEANGSPPPEMCPLPRTLPTLARQYATLEIECATEYI